MKIVQDPNQPSCKLLKITLKHLLVVLLLLVHLLPIWIVKYFPTQDGPSHIYNAQVFKEYHDHNNFRIRDVYQLNWAPFPNWTTHLLMAILMHIFSPLVCEKIVLSLCVLGLPLALFYFLRVIDHNKVIFSLVGVIYSYHYLLMMGFYNFSISVPIFFWTLGYWWKHRNNIIPKGLTGNQPLVGFYLLLMLTYFSHFQSFFLLVISISVFTGLLFLLELQTDKTRPNFISRLQPLIYFATYMLPVYLVALTYYLSTTQGYGRNYRKLSWLNEYFFNLKSLVYFRDDHILIGRFLFVILTILLFYSLWERSIEFVSKSSAKNRIRFKSTDLFLIMFLILTLIYYISHNNIQSGGGWINDRVHIYLVLMLLPFLKTPAHHYLQYILITSLVGLSLWPLAYTAHANFFLDQEITEMTQSTNLIAEYSTLVLYLVKHGQQFSDTLGKIDYVKPFLHVGSYYCLDNRAALLRNYEAALDYFPINYQYQMDTRPYSGPKTSYPQRADYVLAWRMTSDGINKLEQETLGPDYRSIHTAKRYTLYYLNPNTLDVNWWTNTLNINRKELVFDFHPQDTTAALNSISISPISKYENQAHQYGWLTEAKLTSSSQNEQPNPVFQNAITNTTKTDGVFKVVLPNGRYRVTCFFWIDNENPISLIANSEKVIQNLRQTDTTKVIQKVYTITITNQELIQIVYTTGQIWSWCWFKIQPIGKPPDA